MSARRSTLGEVERGDRDRVVAERTRCGSRSRLGAARASERDENAHCRDHDPAPPCDRSNHPTPRLARSRGVQDSHRTGNPCGPKGERAKLRAVTDSLPEQSATAKPRSMRPSASSQAALSIGLGVAVFVFVLPQIADLSEVWKQIQDMTGLEIVVLDRSRPDLEPRDLLDPDRDLHPGPALDPGDRRHRVDDRGVEHGAGGRGGVGRPLLTRCSGRGDSRSPGSRVSAIVSGIWNNFAKLAHAHRGGLDPRARRVAPAVVAVLSALHRVRCAHRRDRDLRAHPAQRGVRGEDRESSRAGSCRGCAAVIRKGPVAGYDLAVVKFRSRVIGLVSHRWAALTFWTIVGHLSLYAVLLVALRQIGVSERRGQLDPGARRVRLRPAAHRDPAHPRRARRDRARPDRRASTRPVAITRRSSARCCSSGSSPTSCRSRSA